MFGCLWREADTKFPRSLNGTLEFVAAYAGGLLLANDPYVAKSTLPNICDRVLKRGNVSMTPKQAFLFARCMKQQQTESQHHDGLRHLASSMIVVIQQQSRTVVHCHSLALRDFWAYCKAAAASKA